MRKWAAAAAFAVLVLVGLWVAREKWGGRAARSPGREGAPVPPEPPHLATGETPAMPKPAESAYRGVVVDEADHPIANALIRWRVFGRNEGPDARTGLDGAFAFDTEGPPNGTYIVEAPGFASRFEDPGTEKITLHRGPRSVRARVVNEEQRPIAGASVEAFVYGAHGRGVADVDGVVKIPGIFRYTEDPGGILVRADGYVPRAVPTFREEDVVGEEVPLDPSLDHLGDPSLALNEDGDVDCGTVTLSRGGVIRGVVRDEATGRPVGGARVSCVTTSWFEGFATADDLGAFEFRAVPLDATWLYAFADGYLPGRAGWLPSALARFDRRVFPEGEREIVRDLLVARSVTVKGVVLDRNGAPAAGATVCVSEQGQDASPRELVPGITSRATTDAKGAFAVAGYYAGTALTVTAETASGFLHTEARTGDREIVLRLEPARCLRGRVVDARHATIPWAQAHLRRPGDERAAHWTQSDVDGRFAFEHVGLGPWELTVDSRGLVTLEKTIDVPDEEGELDLGDLVLGGGCVIGGQVVDAAGLPIENVRVSATSEDERPGGEKSGRARTDAEGRFQITGLHDGEFDVEVRQHGRCRARLTTRAGRTDLRIEMQASVAVRGRVLADGKPLAEAYVHATAGDEGPSTGPDGEFEITVDPGEPFELKISHTFYKTLRLPEVLPWEGVREFALVQGRVFEGTVVDESGKPLPEMWVHVYAAGATAEARAKNDKDFRHAQTDARGRFRVGGLEEGGTVVELSGNVGYVTEDPVEIAAGAASCQLIARKGYEVCGTVRRKDGKGVPEVTVTVYRADGTEVPRGFSWDSYHSRFSTTELLAGRYKLVVAGRSERFAGVSKEEYGEVTVEVTVPGPDVEIVLPK